MNSKIRRRQERALARIEAALDDKNHEWKNDNGPDKARACRDNLIFKGVRPVEASEAA